MRNTLLGMLLLRCCTGWAQSPDEIAIPKFLFKVSPQQFAINTLKIGAEVFNANQTKSVSIFLYGRFDGNESYGSPYSSENRSQGFGGELQFRKYIRPLQNYVTKRGKSFLQGIYFSGYLQSATHQQDFQYYSYIFTSPNTPPINNLIRVDESVFSVGSGFTIGVHRTLWKALFIDAYLGGGVQFANYKRTTSPSDPNNSYYNYTSITDPAYEGILPKFGLMIGVEF